MYINNKVRSLQSSLAQAKEDLKETQFKVKALLRNNTHPEVVDCAKESLKFHHQKVRHLKLTLHKAENEQYYNTIIFYERHR